MYAMKKQQSLFDSYLYRATILLRAIFKILDVSILELFRCAKTLIFFTI